MPSLLKRPSVLAVTALIALVGGALTWLPLFDLPGYELSSALTLMLALAAPYFGIRAAECLITERPTLRELLKAARAALFPAVIAALLPLAFAWITSALSERCSPSSGSALALLLPLPTAVLGVCLGICLKRCLRKTSRALFAVLLVLLASLAISLWPLWAGPQLFALNHLLGAFLGPIYDEALAVDARLLTFRALTLLWALALLLFTALVSASSSISRSWLACAFGACLLALGLCWHFDTALGLRTTEADIDATLGGKLSVSPQLTLHFPREKPKEQVRRLAFEMAFAWSELSELFGATPQGEVHAFFHRSPEEKRRLTGASRTDFAKPWRAQFHVLDKPWPHPTARHELAHLFGAAFGSPIFGVSWRGILGLNVGLIEGLAVAAEAEGDEDFALHAQARAMRELGLLPDLSALLDPAGFYAQPGARAYTASGSFLRFVHERHGGAAALRALYPEGDFVTATGQALPTLIAQWLEALDTIELTPRARSAAQQRFGRGSLFQRPCVREIAALERQAAPLVNADPAQALALYDRCAALVPDDPGFAWMRAELKRSQEDFDGAATLYEDLSSSSNAAPHVQGRALLALAMLDWRAGRLDAARDRLERALALPLLPGDERSALIKFVAIVGDEASRELLRRYFDSGAGLAELLALQRLSEARPDWPIAPYLLGRQLWIRGQGAEALPYLRRAHEAALGHPVLVEENLRVWVDAAFWSGDLAEARAALAEWEALGASVDQRARELWQRRCAFRERHGD
ncbi:MAG: hypothetical protein LBM75_06885 [Myxococcales bacterium]|jgi:hypothetical protein|nr:hypothetical protein [Myxococcales bacterium]